MLVQGLVIYLYRSTSISLPSRRRARLCLFKAWSSTSISLPLSLYHLDGELGCTCSRLGHACSTSRSLAGCVLVPEACSTSLPPARARSHPHASSTCPQLLKPRQSRSCWHCSLTLASFSLNLHPICIPSNRPSFPSAYGLHHPGSKPERLRSGSLQADLSFIVSRVIRASARKLQEFSRFFLIYDSQLIPTRQLEIRPKIYTVQGR